MSLITSLIKDPLASSAMPNRGSTTTIRNTLPTKMGSAELSINSLFVIKALTMLLDASLCFGRANSYFHYLAFVYIRIPYLDRCVFTVQFVDIFENMVVDETLERSPLKIMS